MKIAEASATAVSPSKLGMAVGVPIVSFGLMVGAGAPLHAPVGPLSTHGVTIVNRVSAVAGFHFVGGYWEREPFDLGESFPQHVPTEWVVEMFNAHPNDVAPFEISWDESD